MERCQKAVHLRTGDPGTDGAVSTWLERHGIEVVACADAFEACTVALRRRELTPDVVFVGADWLAPDERAIIGYFRESWPGVATVVYGSAPAIAELPAQPLTLVCRSAGAVQQMLADSPNALLSRLRQGLRSPAPAEDGWHRQPGASAPEGRRASGGETSLPDATVQIKNAEEPPGKVTPPAAPRDSAAAPGKPVPLSGSILTEEELAALLEKDPQ